LRSRSLRSSSPRRRRRIRSSRARRDSIQAAVAEARPADRELVKPGIHHEDGVPCPTEPNHTCAVVIENNGIELVGVPEAQWHSAAYLNWVLRQASGWRVVVVVGVLLVSVDARPYLGPRPGRGR
jgi:hypothetical protein